MPIALTDIVSRADDIIFAEIESETVLMSEANGTYYGLTLTSQEIWNQLENPLSVSELFGNLSKIYQIPTNFIEGDVIDFLEYCREKGIITVKTAPME